MGWITAYDRMRAVAVAGTLGLTLLAVAAPAGAHKPRPQGDFSRHTEVKRTENGHTRNDTWTGANGTATRSAKVVNDRDRKMRTRDVAWSGPQGQQAQRTDVTQRTDTGYTRNTVATGPKGGTATRDVVATRDAGSGTWTKDVTVDRTPPPPPPADDGASR